MSTITLSAPATRTVSPGPAPARATTARPAPAGPATTRPGRRSGRGAGPVGRPATGAPAPQLRRATVTGPSACVAPAAPTRPRPQLRPLASSVRLTERGIALILVAGVLVTVAALTVVGATATRVTSDRYQLATISSR